MLIEIQIERDKDLKNLEELCLLERECFGDRAWNKDQIKGELENKSSYCILAKSKDKIIGYLLGRVILDEAELLRIGVKPLFRNMKIGTTLLKTYLLDLKKMGIKRVYLEVSEKNEKAYNLYKKLGFNPVNIRKDYYERGCSAIIMCYQF